MNTLPAWREKAPPGVSLKEARGAEVDSVQTASPRAIGAGLTQILRPEAAVRWRSTRVSMYTPQYVEWVLTNSLSGDLVAVWELFDLMEDTWPRLNKNLNEIKRSVAAMKWTVVPWVEEDEVASPEAEERAKLVSHIIWKMRPEPGGDGRDFSGIVYDLLDAWGKGLSVIELIWDQRATRKFGEITAVKEGQWVHPNNYGIDDDGSLGLRTAAKTMMAGDATILPFPAYKFLVGVAKAKTSHFVGAALLRPMAWWWAASNFSAQWLLNYAQLFGIPIRWANYSSDASQVIVDKVCDMLANVGSAGWAAFPEGTVLNILEGAKTAGQSPQESILDRADRQCDLLILGQTLTSDAGDRGTQALGMVHERVRADVFQCAADWVAGVLTQQLVPWMLELNYGDAELAPELKAEPVREEDQAANADRVAKLLAAGVPLPKEWLYEHLDIPLPGPDDEVLGGAAQNAPGAIPAVMTPGGGQSPRYGELQTTAEGSGDRREGLVDPISAAMADPGEATADLVRQAVADAAKVRTRWLEPLSQEMERLIQAAQNDQLTDEELQIFLQDAQQSLPDIFTQLDTAALAESIEAYLGAAVVKAVAAKA